MDLLCRRGYALYMEPTDLTVRILQDIREELRGIRADQEQDREEDRQYRKQAAERFTLVDTSLRDMAEQLVMLARGIKSLLEARSSYGGRIEKLEERVARLEDREAG